MAERYPVIRKDRDNGLFNVAVYGILVPYKMVFTRSPLTQPMFWALEIEGEYFNHGEDIDINTHAAYEGLDEVPKFYEMKTAGGWAVRPDEIEKYEQVGNVVDNKLVLWEGL